MIDAIKKGDVFAFEKAYQIHREKLYAYFLKKTNSAEDAKDLLQTTFFKLWQYRKSLSEEYLPEQQLFYIARNVFIDYLRKENKIRKIKSVANASKNINQSPDIVYEFDLQARLQKVLIKLPWPGKKVFELYKIEGYSYKEIADILNISVKCVDNNLAKTLKYLRGAELLLIICTLFIFY